MRNPLFRFALLLAAALLAGCGSANTGGSPPPASPAALIELLPDPGMKNPVLHFGDGGVQNSRATLFPGTTPPMGYTDYGWWVAQWNKTSSDTPPIPYYLKPDSYIENDPATVDPALGAARLAFYAENDPAVSQLALYKDPALNNWVYALWSQDGLLDTGGGSNLFLSNYVNSAAASTLDADVHLQFRTRIARRVLTFNDPAARTDGSVLGSYFTGLTVNYTDPGTGKVYWNFLQIAHANTWESANNYQQCMSLGGDGIPDVFWAGVLPGDTFLSSAPSSGPLVALDFDVNKYVCALARTTWNCNGVSTALPAAALDLRNWQITSLYIGLETENRAAPNNSVVRGHAGLGVDIEDLHLVKNPGTAGPACTP